MLQVRGKDVWPWLVITIILMATAYQLRAQGRLWWCSCDRVMLWAGNVWSAHNSQHLFDPYTFTHLLHGFLFCWLLTLCAGRWPTRWRLCLAISIEAFWEVVENAEFIIQRYREATAALGYQGDTVLNSLGDIIACGVGFMLAAWLGFRRSLLVFALVEVALLIMIKDSLILNIIMLIYPLESIKAWQTSY